MAGKILILNHQFNNKEHLLAILLNDSETIRIENCHSSILGNIYKGRVNAVSKSINACFVEYAKGEQCFLSLDNNKNLKVGDEIIIQIERESMGTKLPSGTMDFSLSGHFLVLSLNKRGLGFSNKLSSKDKHYLKDLLEDTPSEYFNENLPYGFIMRTNATELTSKEQLLSEYDELTKIADEIIKYGQNRTIYSVLRKSEPDYITFIKNCYENDYDEIITDIPLIYEELVNKISRKPVRLYEDVMVSLSKLYSINSRLESVLGSKIWLKSGGWLRIQSTEALTAIDVNSGKFESKNKTPSEMILKINKEAADEIMHQLILRNLSGIIVVDFINMKDVKARKELMSYLKILAKDDPIKTEIVDITRLGLVEITRKKINKTLREQFLYQGDGD